MCHLARTPTRPPPPLFKNNLPLPPSFSLPPLSFSLPDTLPPSRPPSSLPPSYTHVAPTLHAYQGVSRRGHADEHYDEKALVPACMTVQTLHSESW
jgi:hypothetical protein